uniref:Uncharacterized protein n=1 Tax=Solanum tuberosum TaxID=4113 RepID=M1AGK2_SOLTU
MVVNAKPTTIEYDAVVGNDDDPELTDIHSYHQFVGETDLFDHHQTIYMFCSPSSQSINATSQRSHWDSALRVLRYLKQAPGQGVLLKKGNITSLTSCCDSEWEAFPNTRRGYVIQLGDSLISWKSKKQHTISRSSTEADYKSIAGTVVEIIWLVGLLRELNIDIITLVKLCCDSKVAMHIASNPIFHERTKHIEIDCHFIREKYKDGLIKREYVGTKSQILVSRFTYKRFGDCATSIPSFQARSS